MRFLVFQRETRTQRTKQYRPKIGVQIPVEERLLSIAYGNLQSRPKTNATTFLINTHDNVILFFVI